MWLPENGSAFDPAVEFAVITVGAVTVLSVFAWLLSCVVKRHAAACHSVLLAGLLGCLVCPFVVAGFMTADVSLISLRADSHDDRGHADRGHADRGHDDRGHDDRGHTTAGDQAGRQFDGDLADDTEHRADLSAERPQIEHSRIDPSSVDRPTGTVLPLDDRTVAERTIHSGRATTFRAQPATPTADDPLRATFTLVSIVWSCGTLFLLAAIVRSWRTVLRLRSSLRPVDDERMERVVDQICRMFGMKRRPDIAVSTELRAPVTIGVLHPLIILPAQSLAAITQNQLRDVLIHEIAHIARRDQIVVLVQAFSRALYWPIVFVHLLHRRLARMREEVCDNFVLAQSDPVSYGETLLCLAELSRHPVPLAGSVGILHWRGMLEDRIAGLIDERRSHATSASGSVRFAIVAMFVVIGVLSCGTTLSSATAGRTDEPVRSTNSDARKQTDPYDVLYDVVMTRYKDGKAYAQDETSPSIFAWSEFPFDDRTFEKFVAALDGFAALPQGQIEEYSAVKRALMQRHLWTVFDSTFDWDWKPNWWWSGRKSFPKTHMDRRKAVQPKLASLMRRLALTREQILGLPNPLAATVKAELFSKAHDPADRFKPFLPPDIYAHESSWICLGEDKEPIPAGEHTSRLYSRSMFLQFIRLPQGRDETLEHLDRIRKRPHQFPVGTQFALVEQPFLISKDDELVLSPMVTSVQLRAYLNVARRFSSSEDNPQVTQCVAEFVMQPRELMKGNAVMKAMGPDDFRYDAGAPDSVGFNPRDPFATGEIAGRMPKTSRLHQCMSCHGGAGGRGVRTRNFAGTNSFSETSAEEISKATSAQKRTYDDWKTLLALWQGKTRPKDKDAAMAAKAEPEKQSANKPDVFPDTPKLRTLLTSRMEAEAAHELKKLHTAMLLAETAKLSEMFRLDEADTRKLRLAAPQAAANAVEKTRDALKATIVKSSGIILNESDVDLGAFTINGKFIRFAPRPDGWNPGKIIKEKNGSYVPADTGLWVDTTLSVKVRRRAANTAISIGFYGSFVNNIGPLDSDVQQEEVWNSTLSAVLTKEQFAHYTEHEQSRLKSTVVDMLLTALAFDLDLPDAQLPVVRRRVEERVNPDSSNRSSFVRGDIERTVAGYLRRLKSEDLADILTKEQLDQFPERSKGEITSTIITLILRELQFDLRLRESQLPVFRQRLEALINRDALSYSIETAAMRIRWQLKEDVIADVLTEPQLTLWRFTQEQH